MPCRPTREWEKWHWKAAAQTPWRPNLHWHLCLCLCLHWRLHWHLSMHPGLHWHRAWVLPVQQADGTARHTVPSAPGPGGTGRGACGSVDLKGSAVLPSVYTDSRSAVRCWRVLWLFLPAARASSTVNWWALPLSCAARPPWAAISRWRAGSMAAKPRRAGLRSSCKALRTPLVLSAAVRPPVLAEGCAVAPAARLAPWYADREMAWESVLLLAVMYFSPLGWEPLVRSAEAFFSTTHR